VAVVKTWARECWPAWGVALILFTLLTTLIGPWVVQQTVPASRYYELRSVTIADTTPGVSPQMIVDRTIRQDFRGRRDIEIMRVTGSEFEVYTTSGANTLFVNSCGTPAFNMGYEPGEAYYILRADESSCAPIS